MFVLFSVSTLLVSIGCFSFQSADYINFMIFLLYFSFCLLYYVQILMKGYAMLVLFMHLFCLMNPKGEKNWKLENG